MFFFSDQDATEPFYQCTYVSNITITLIKSQVINYLKILTKQM